MGSYNQWPDYTGPDAVTQVEAKPIEHWLRGRTMVEVLDQAAADAGTQIAVRFLATPEAPPIDITYSELAERAGRYAAAFASIAPQSVVASLLPALPETIAIAFGAMRAGILLPINPFLEAESIASMLKAARATVLLVEGSSGDQGVAQKLLAIRAALPNLRVFVCGEGEVEDGLDAFADGSQPIPSAPGPDDIAGYIHTGGTTGNPKIAQLTHANFAFASFLMGFASGMRAGDVIPCAMPTFHSGGLILGTFAPMAARATVLFLGRAGFRDREMVAAFWRIIEREAGAILFGPPTVAQMVMENVGTLPPSVRNWVSSAASLPVETFRRFRERTGLEAKEAWGLTESSLAITFTPTSGQSRAGSCGQRLPYCEIAVMRREGDKLVAKAEAGEAGAILVRSPGLFAGYLGQPRPPLIDSSHLGEGGWLDTGDLGYLDAEGWLHVTGRAKDIILRGGHNIDPLPIEMAFTALPEVRAAAAVGRPDKRVGELPVVFLTLDQDADPDDLTKKANLAIPERAARPVAVTVLPEMPLTRIGKIDKTALRLMAAKAVLEEAFGKKIAVDVFSTPSGGIAAALTPCPDGAEGVLSAYGLGLGSSNRAHG
jgi:fatty-acyl-CoA synthase